MKHNVVILGSECARVDYYAELVKERVEAVGISGDDYELRRIRCSGVSNTGDNEGLEMLERFGLSDRCTIGYCAGCNFQQSYGDERYMPALIIDDKVVLDSCFPKSDQLDEVLKEHLK